VGKLFIRSRNGSVDSAWFHILCIAVSFPNTINMPIMIMQTLCEQRIVNADYDNDSNKCYDAVTGMLFLYSVGFHCMYWTYAVVKLRAASVDCDPSNAIADKGVWAAVQHVLTTPSFIGVYIGIFIGLVGPVRKSLFESETIFRSFGSSMKTLGQPVVAIQTMVMAASLGHLDFSKFQQNGGFSTSAGVVAYSPLEQTDQETDMKTVSPEPGIEMLGSAPEGSSSASVTRPGIMEDADFPSVSEVLMMITFR
jgi:predicted permease